MALWNNVIGILQADLKVYVHLIDDYGTESYKEYSKCPPPVSRNLLTLDSH
jgi:hypothetical protein